MQDERSDPAGRDKAPQEAPFAEEMRLPDDFVERSRPDALGERFRLASAIESSFLPEIGGGGHVGGDATRRCLRIP